MPAPAPASRFDLWHDESHCIAMDHGEAHTDVIRPRGRRVVRREDIARRIVLAAVDEVVRIGADRLSMADVAKIARVSRTTLYKYHPDKDSLLSGVGDHIRLIYADELRAAIAGVDEPAARLRAVLDFMHAFHKRWRVEHMITLRNQSVLDDINRNFGYYNDLLKVALGPVLQALADRGVDELVRDLMVETLIRVQLSNALVALGPEWDQLAGSLYRSWFGKV